MPSTASTSPSSRARRSAWSASPAAASRRSRAASCGCSSRPRGTIVFDGADITHMSGARSARSAAGMQMVFQDPYASLNPRKRVRQIVGDPLRIHGIGDAGGAAPRASRSLLALVGLSPEHLNRYASEFSGGQRQRIGVARALALQPKLDRRRRARVGARRLDPGADHQPARATCRRRFGLTYVFIAHDLGVIHHVADRIAVMYLGKIVELAPGRVAVRDGPVHPYTEALLSAIPIADPDRNERRVRLILEGDVPSPLAASFGLPVPHALPVRDRDLHDGRAAARRARWRGTWPPATTRATRPRAPGPRSTCRERYPGAARRSAAGFVAFSGGKAIRGPQGSGSLAGRRDLIDSVRLQTLDLDVDGGGGPPVSAARAARPRARARAGGGGRPGARRGGAGAPRRRRGRGMTAWTLAGATIVDGTGAEPRTANVVMDGDRIASVEGAERRGTVIDATGLVAAPGFVDIHSHVDWIVPLRDRRRAARPERPAGHHDRGRRQLRHLAGAARRALPRAARSSGCRSSASSPASSAGAGKRSPSTCARSSGGGCR